MGHAHARQLRQDPGLAFKEGARGAPHEQPARSTQFGPQGPEPACIAATCGTRSMPRGEHCDDPRPHGQASILRQHPDWLLTLLTAVLALMIFVFAPLQAAGIFLFQTFAIAGLLVIITAALVISRNTIALWLMVIAFVANLIVFFMRIYYPWPYNLTLLAAAWLIIAATLGVVVAQAVFRSGRITYHRIIGAILLYLLIAVTFATLFAFVGLSISDSFKGIAFEVMLLLPARCSI